MPPPRKQLLARVGELNASTEHSIDELKDSPNAEWSNFAALKQTFGSADRVGNCVVFDVGNNRYCLIGRVFYPHKFYVLRVMDHQEYSRNAWAKQCGCHNPPPTRSVATMRADRRTKRVPGSRGKRGE